MLKNYQVLLPDWLEGYIQYLADRYDLSFSEIIRSEMCFSIPVTMPSIYPEFKPGITVQELFKLRKEYSQDIKEREEMHRLMSKLYFETRKAVEYRLAKEKKLKKK